MSHELTIIDPALLALINNSFDVKGLPLPFVREIFLLECHVAGTSHLDLQGIEPGIKQEDLFIFRREPDNPYDSLAILIFDREGHKLGYVPRDRNEVLARLMDAGKLIFGRLDSKGWERSWLILNIRIFMRDM